MQVQQIIAFSLAALVAPAYSAVVYTAPASHSGTVEWTRFSNTTASTTSPFELGGTPSTLSTTYQVTSSSASTKSAVESASLAPHTVLPIGDPPRTEASSVITTQLPSPQARASPQSATGNEGYYKSEVLEGLAGFMSFLKGNTSSLEHDTGNNSASGASPDLGNTTYTNSSIPRCGLDPAKANMTLLVFNTSGPVFALLDRDSMQIIIWQAPELDKGPDSTGTKDNSTTSQIATVYQDSKFFYWGASIAFFLVGGLVYVALAMKKVHEGWKLGRDGWRWLRGAR